MDRNELNAKTKPQLLELAATLNLAVTPAMTKADLVEIVAAGSQLSTATPPPIPAPLAPPPAPAPAADAAPADPMAQMMARMAAMEQGLAAANAENAALRAAAVAAPAAPSEAELAKVYAAEDRANPLPQEGKLRSLDGAAVDDRKVRLTIAATETETGDVKLGVNGHMLQIRRGVPVVVPIAYLEVLRNSTIDTVTKDPETGVVSGLQIARYPFTAEPV